MRLEMEPQAAVSQVREKDSSRVTVPEERRAR